MVDLSKMIGYFLQSIFYYLMSKSKRNVTLLSKFLQKKSINCVLCVSSLSNVKNKLKCDTTFKISTIKIKELNQQCFHLLMPQKG